MKWTIKPLRGVGDVEFGMKAEEARRAVGSPCESFRRGDEKHPSDHFAELGLFAYYTPRGRLEALEMAAPATPTFDGENLLALPYDKLLKHVARHDPDLETDDAGFTAPNVGIGAYAPEAAEHPKKKPESIIVFRKGYYD